MLQRSSPVKKPITGFEHPRIRLRCFGGLLICFFSALHLYVAVGVDASSPFIQGYTNKRSYAPGNRIDFHISSRLDRYTITIRRLGSVQQPIFKKIVESGRSYDKPPDASARGAGWPVGLSLKVPPDWVSGYYEVFLGGTDPTRPAEWIDGQTTFFIVRAGSPGERTSILMPLTTNMWNAYESWGGKSLYSFNSTNNRQGHRVSFLRPIKSGVYEWEAHFIIWAEQQGYKIDYAANEDLEFHPELLNHYKLILSVGHDEYWSKGMRDHLEAFIAKGGNAAFFSGNSVTWQIRFVDDGQAMVSWKKWYRDDPLYNPGGPNPLLTTLWSHHLVNRPENSLTGVGMMHGGMHRSQGQYMDGSGAFTVHRADHWVFEGTGLNNDDEFGGTDSIVGYEVDGCDFESKNGRPVPTHRDGTPESFQILATAPASWPDGLWIWHERFAPDQEGNACMGIYTSGGGGNVFTAATTDWARGLRGGDQVVERITRNVLDRLSR